MLSSFAEQKAAAVVSAVAGMHGVLAQGRSGAETSFSALSQAANSANDAIKASDASPTSYTPEVLSVGPEYIREHACQLRKAQCIGYTLVRGLERSSNAHTMAVCAQAEDATAAEGHTAAIIQRRHMEQSLHAALADSSSAGAF